jgi:hypothetical protein
LTLSYLSADLHHDDVNHCFLFSSGQIRDVAGKLRESNKALCRNLRESPDVQGNIAKMQSERSHVQQWLMELQTELNSENNSYAGLVTTCDGEKKQMEMLNEVRRKQREAASAVRMLEGDLAREKSEYDGEAKAANSEIFEIKEELHRTQAVSSLEYSFEERRLNAKESAAAAK